MLTETHVVATDRRARFGGIKVYTEAGGISAVWYVWQQMTRPVILLGQLTGLDKGPHKKLTSASSGPGCNQALWGRMQRGCQAR
jgi:hypothetical protein